MTDNAAALKERLEAVTGERISGLEGIGEDMRTRREAGREAGPGDKERERDRVEDAAVRRIGTSAARRRSARRPSPRRRLQPDFERRQHMSSAGGVFGQSQSAPSLRSMSCIG